MELSAVQELTNVGLGHAATALSELMGKELLISVPTVDQMQVESIPELVGGPEVPTVAVAMEVEGDLAGTLAFVMARTDATVMARAVHKSYMGDAGNFEMLERSLFLEVGNIIDSSFLNAISEMTNTSTIATVPILVEDMAASVVMSILAHATQSGDSALIFETKMLDDASSMMGFFLYIPAENALRKVLARLGIQEAA
jgi:chemotaxis protein CheC